jgi:hypothetical protein
MIFLFLGKGGERGFALAVPVVEHSADLGRAESHSRKRCDFVRRAARDVGAQDRVMGFR